MQQSIGRSAGLRIRPARGDELAALRVLERRAGAAFRDLGMDAVADDEPESLESLSTYQRAGRALVAVDAGRPVGYLLLRVVAAAAHVEQVSVDPGHARRRVGASLVEAAAAWARDRGLSSMTLTTFADVPWNAPYYARLGFAEVREADQPEQLRAIRRREAERGLDCWPRVAMRRELG